MKSQKIFCPAPLVQGLVILLFVLGCCFNAFAQEATTTEDTRLFDTAKIWIFLAVILYSATVVFCIYHARSGKELFIRRIPGLEAVDEAIGRATEMGRSIMYILGLGGVSNVATIASMNILSQVAQKTAD